MAKATKKKPTTRTAKTKSAAATVPGQGQALSPREQAKALLAQKTSAAKWQGLYVNAKQITTVVYNMKNTYEKQTAITHKTLGWGYITDNRNGRLEVLFKEGIKYLISNYK